MNSRQIEIQKYRQSYQDPRYGMGPARQKQARQLLDSVMPMASYLDVACGRGEMLEYAQEVLNIKCTMGAEVVEALISPGRIVYGEAHDLPFADNQFDVVGSFDVLEHLVRSDVDMALRELSRVAGFAVLLTVSNTSSVHLGQELHPTRLAYMEWDQAIRGAFEGWRIQRVPSEVTFNQPWRITWE